MATSQKSPFISVPHWRLKWGWRKKNITTLNSNRFDEAKDAKASLHSPGTEPIFF